MGKLSENMREALSFIARWRSVSVGSAYPGEPVDFLDFHAVKPQGRTLIALWKRGLVRFDVHVQLTSDGKQAIQEDIRTRPGERNFRVID